MKYFSLLPKSKKKKEKKKKLPNDCTWSLPVTVISLNKTHYFNKSKTYFPLKPKKSNRRNVPNNFATIAEIFYLSLHHNIFQTRFNLQISLRLLFIYCYPVRASPYFL